MGVRRKGGRGGEGTGGEGEGKALGQQDNSTRRCREKQKTKARKDS